MLQSTTFRTITVVVFDAPMLLLIYHTLNNTSFVVCHRPIFGVIGGVADFCHCYCGIHIAHETVVVTCVFDDITVINN